MDKKNKILIGIGSIAVIIAVGAGAFFVGMNYKKKGGALEGRVGGPMMNDGGFGNPRKQMNPRQGTGQQDGRRVMQGGVGAGQGMILGEIISKDGTSITVKTKDGSSKVIYYSDSTDVNKSVESSKDELSSGQQVMVGGKSNSDGTVTAENIQIRP